MRRRAVVWVSIAIALCVGWWARGFMAVDACLDAGGRWEARGGFCDGAHSEELDSK